MTERKTSAAPKKQPAKRPFKGKVGDGTPGPGRPPGKRNKVKAVHIAQLVEIALERAGASVQQRRKDLKALEPGVAYLVEQAENKPELFMPLVKQLMPAKIDLDVQVMSRELIDLMSERRQQLARMRDITPPEQKVIDHEPDDERD